jgi:hypothetical protein
MFFVPAEWDNTTRHLFVPLSGAAAAAVNTVIPHHINILMGLHLTFIIRPFRVTGG